jgi:hypothetical protein
MEHESDSESEPASEYVYNAALDLRSHERYSHAAHEHLDFKEHILPLYLPPPKKIKMNTKSITDSRETMKQRIHRVQSKFTAAQLLCLRMEFNAFDIDASNTIDLNELRSIIDSLGGKHIKNSELRKLMNTIDEDQSGEVDWIEYLDMMLALQNGSADQSVSDFLTRHPIVLLVYPDKQPARYLRTMLYKAGKEANIDIHVVQAFSAQGALTFLKQLPPGRKVSMILSSFEMYPHDGRKMYRYMKRNLFWTPPIYFLTNSYASSKLHKPEGCEKILLMLEVEQHEVMLIVIRHCSTKKKNTNLMSAHMRGLMHAHSDIRHENDVAHRVHKKNRIGNRGIAFKPSRPRDKTNFAFVSSTRWKGAFDSVSPRVFHEVLSKCGGESPRLIPVSPRGTVGSIHVGKRRNNSRFRRGGGNNNFGTMVSGLNKSVDNGVVSGGSEIVESDDICNNDTAYQFKFDLTRKLEEISMSRILPPISPMVKSPRPTIHDLRKATALMKEKIPEEVVADDAPFVFTPRRR